MKYQNAIQSANRRRKRGLKKRNLDHLWGGDATFLLNDFTVQKQQIKGG